MAAIIAQISLQAANRRRDQTKRIPIDKSNVKLPAFDPHFDPKKHNAYNIRYSCCITSCNCNDTFLRIIEDVNI